MNGAVGAAIFPNPFNILVSGVIANDEGEHAVNAPLVLHHIAPPQGNILGDARLSLSCGRPLDGVPRSAHGGAANADDLVGADKVIHRCNANHSPYSSSSSVRR